MTRAKTLGWYYETKQIKDRIAMYQGVMIYAPRTKIRQITQKPENKFIQDAIDRGNMKLASIAKNIIVEYDIEPEQIHQASLSAYAHSRHLLSELSTQKTEIEDLQTKINVLKKYRKLKVYGDEMKALSGRQEKKYRNEHLYELSQLSDIREKVL
ncbi:MAG: relaxase, partial [Ruminococcus sp.]|nr:relaxase [Ruminococcus sp.]